MSTPAEIARDSNDLEKIAGRNRSLDNLQRTRSKMIEQRDTMNANIARYDNLIAQTLDQLNALKETLIARYKADKVRIP